MYIIANILSCTFKTNINVNDDDGDDDDEWAPLPRIIQIRTKTNELVLQHEW